MDARDVWEISNGKTTFIMTATEILPRLKTVRPAGVGQFSAKVAGLDDALPPHDVPAEQGVLGCILLAPAECLTECVAKLQGDALAFYELRHQVIFAHVAAMHRDSEAVDVITLQRRLKEAGELENAGGIAYLASLPDVVPSAANVSFYVNIVREKYAQRRVMQTCAEASADVLAHPEHTPAILRALGRTVEQLEREAAHEAEVLDAAELIAAPRILPPEIIAGILHEGSKLVIGGGSKSFKTWTQLDMALSVASGSPWLGRATTKSRVLVADLELQRDFWAGRAERVANAKGIQLERGQLTVRNLRGKAAHYRTVLPEIERAAKGEGARLIIIDPIYKLYGGADENSAGDVAELLNGLARLSVQTGAAVAFGAHFSKGNQSAKESIDRISGSGVFARDPDSILVFTKHEEENAFTVECTLRNLAPVAPFVVRWEFPLMRPAIELDPTALKKTASRPAKLKPDPDQVLDLFRDCPATPRAGLMTAVELRDAFRKRGWDDAAAPAMRDSLEGQGRLKVWRGPHNQKLSGLPSVVDAHEAQLANAGTLLEQPAMPATTKRKGRVK